MQGAVRSLPCDDANMYVGVSGCSAFPNVSQRAKIVMKTKPTTSIATTWASVEGYTVVQTMPISSGRAPAVNKTIPNTIGQHVLGPRFVGVVTEVVQLFNHLSWLQIVRMSWREVEEKQADEGKALANGADPKVPLPGTILPPKPGRNGSHGDRHKHGCVCENDADVPPFIG